MNNSLKIIIAGQPQAKQRSRKGVHNNWYNPQADEMESVKKQIKRQLPEEFIMIGKKIPVIVNSYFFFYPAKTYATKKFLKEIEDDDIPHVKKKDRDNLDKFFLDCMSGIMFYDDCQVYGGEIFKYWSSNPRTEIEVMW